MTIPYVSGTVSVTAGSAVVTGNGTGWQTGLVTGGLFGLDSANGNPVPILSIDSDTQLTLAKPWRGTTAANQAYWIIRDTAYGQQTVANAQALAAYIQRLDNAALAALATLAPAADKMAYFNGATTAALSDLKSKGRDIIAADTMLQLLGKLGPVNGGNPSPTPSAAGVGLADGDFNTITVPGSYTINGSWINGYLGAGAASYGGILNVYLRGNGQIVQEFYVPSGSRALVFQHIFASGTWRSWTLTQTGVVGTVSRTAGIIDGDVIERGSNANGEYVRFADGTQICTMRIVANQSCNAAFGTSFYGTRAFTFPIAFVNATSIVISGAARAGGHIVTATTDYDVLTATSGSAFLLSPISFTNLSTDTRLTAIGRWF